VIVLDPCYDSYEPNIELAGGVAVHVPLTPRTFEPDFGLIKAAMTTRTRAIIINSPHNPSATIWSREHMLQLTELVRGTDIILVSDEVYEHMVFDGELHQSASGFPELAQRSFVVSSFGKTYHVTGWKVGYVAAPAALMAEFRKVHQFNVFTVNTPMQVGIAEYLKDPAPYLELPAFYQQKRDFFREGLANSRFKLLPCDGTYFQCVDYSAISDLPEAEFSQWLTSEIGVAAIPVSAFYHESHESGVVRFCFAKKEETLRTALERLASL
jgi:methionine aminotransferase